MIKKGAGLTFAGCEIRDQNVRFQVTGTPLKFTLGSVSVAIAATNGSLIIMVAEEVTTALKTGLDLIVLASRTKLAGFVATTFYSPIIWEED